MNLVLFDLDHTLLPQDSDREWGKFLAKIGALKQADYQEINERFYADYCAGKLDNEAFLRFTLAPLAQFPRAQLNAWRTQYLQEIIQPMIQPCARNLVQHHLEADDLCCIITATNRFISEPIAQEFGIPYLIATEPETYNNNPDSDYTGTFTGIPSFREGKIQRAEQWLNTLGKTWSSFARSIFYSDSINDLPLLKKVSHPIATNPDPLLRKEAQKYNWPILDLFSSDHILSFQTL